MNLNFFRHPPILRVLQRAIEETERDLHQSECIAEQYRAIADMQQRRLDRLKSALADKRAEAAYADTEGK